MTEEAPSASYRVFLSHGGEDLFICKELLEPGVAGSGASVYLDAAAIQSGDDFRREILGELNRCDELLVLLTASSVKRPWVFAEIGATLIRNKRIVPIRYGVKEKMLYEKGVISLLGTRKVLCLDEFKNYVSELKSRVEKNSHG